MKPKVLSILKPKTASLGFTAEELDGVAENIAKTLKEDATDEQINQAIEAALPYLQMSQKAVTRIVNAEKAKSQKEKEEADKKAKEEAEKAAKEKGVGSGADEEPAWFRAYREQQDAKFAAIDNERVSAKRLAVFESMIKDLPEKQKTSELSSFKRLVPTFKDDDDFNTFMEEKKTSIGEMVQETANIGLGGLSKPGVGGSGKLGDKPASDEECDAIVARIM